MEWQGGARSQSAATWVRKRSWTCGSAPSPSASPSLFLEHHRRRRRLAVAENRDPRSAWRRVEELGYGESAGAAGPGALENA